jgi:hypothetical protein
MCDRFGGLILRFLLVGISGGLMRRILPQIVTKRSSAMMLFCFAKPQLPDMRSQSNAALEVDTGVVGSSAMMAVSRETRRFLRRIFRRSHRTVNVADIEVDVHFRIPRDLSMANNGVQFPSNNTNHCAVLNPANPDVRRSFESFRIISSWLYQNFAPRNQAFESSATWYSVVGIVDFSTSPPHFTGLPLFHWPYQYLPRNEALRRKAFCLFALV